MYGTKLVVLDCRGKELEIFWKVYIDERSLEQVVRIVLDYDSEMFQEYMREINTNPSLEYVVNNWVKEKYED